MALKYLPNGNLTPGVHPMNWDDFVDEFGYTNHRKMLIDGMKKAINALKKCSCERLYIDGSFVTKKLVPKDWDGCYDEAGMHMQKLRKEFAIFYNISPPRQEQKDIFKGEVLPASLEIRFPLPEKTIIDCFQLDINDDSSKGIVQLSLKNYII
jgi:hypothetical protein